MNVLTIEALSPASLARTLKDMDHETRTQVIATENGTPWARLDISPMTDTRRAVFPLHSEGFRGDTRKRGQSGVQFNSTEADHALSVVIERARKMYRA